MGILARLRESFTVLTAWEPGYAALLSSLPQGHSLSLAGKASQRDPGSTGCAYSDNVLLPALRSSERCVDQEFLDAGMLRDLLARD
jgi:hypothetical protein